MTVLTRILATELTPRSIDSKDVRLKGFNLPVISLVPTSLDSNDKLIKKGKIEAYKISKYIAIYPVFTDKTSDKWEVAHILTGLAFGAPYDNAETAKEVAEAFAKFRNKLNFSSFETAPKGLIKELIKISHKFR